ncbi:MAG: hypothetical protein RJA07_1972 [Bacteroidota bacterium]|jgi:hypothetical protein
MKNQKLCNYIRKPLRSLASQTQSNVQLLNKKDAEIALLHRFLTQHGLLLKIIFSGYEKFLIEENLPHCKAHYLLQHQLTPTEEKQFQSLLQRKFTNLKYLHLLYKNSQIVPLLYGLCIPLF